MLRTKIKLNKIKVEDAKSGKIELNNRQIKGENLISKMESFLD